MFAHGSLVRRPNELRYRSHKYIATILQRSLGLAMTPLLLPYPPLLREGSVALGRIFRDLTIITEKVRKHDDQGHHVILPFSKET